MQLGEILVRAGAITEEELLHALWYQDAHPCRIGEALLQLGYCSEAQVWQGLAQQVGMPFVDLTQTPPSPEALMALPASEGQGLGVVPVSREGGRLLVAARNPYDFYLDARLRTLTALPVVVGCGIPTQIDDLLENYAFLRHWRGLESEIPSPPSGTLNPESEASGALRTVNQRVEALLRQGARRLRLDIEDGVVSVAGFMDDEETLLARIPVAGLRLDVEPAVNRVDAPSRPCGRLTLAPL